MMAAVTVSGTVTKCEMTTKTDEFNVDRYDGLRGKERYVVRLNVCLTADDGRRYFFDSPAARKTVSCPPGCPVVIVLYWLDGTSGDWFEETKGSGVASAEKAETKRLLPRVKVGDRLTVRASVKAEKPGYTALNRVKMIKEKAST